MASAGDESIAQMSVTSSAEYIIYWLLKNNGAFAVSESVGQGRADLLTASPRAEIRKLVANLRVERGR